MAVKLPAEVEQCVFDCEECHDLCLATLSGVCLERGGAHVEPGHMRTMMDCCQICRTAADFMLRQSRQHALVCHACSEICDTCARSCEEIGGMGECVEACRRCAASCRQMAMAMH